MMTRLAFLIGLGLGLLSVTASAQLSAPIEGAVPSGSGPGIHSPNSPFAPLPQRDDVLAWSMLTDVKLKKVKAGCASFRPRCRRLTPRSSAFRAS